MAKLLKELLQQLPEAKIVGNEELVITQLTYDSRAVEPGALFICLPGAHVDGHHFVEQALAKGAVAILAQKELSVTGATVIYVSDTRLAMQAIAPYFYDYPSRSVRLIGITGTNGKTTATHLIREIFRTAGYEVGLIGTIHSLIGEKELPIKNTTPDVLDLQHLLKQMADAKMDYVVMEVSSHALDLGRVAGCEYDVVAFTNMTQDHLDYHKTFDNYRKAKGLLFSSLGQNATKKGKMAVINRDDEAGKYMAEQTKEPVLFYGLSPESELRAEDIQIHAGGMEVKITGPFGSVNLKLKITGQFNVYNVLTAMGVALAENIDIAVICKALESFETVPGRFELVDAGQNFTVIVDYAHTPDGLENILKTARQFAEKRIITVFGCGGDRDRTKRPIMGRIAMEYSDIVLATSDNPRTEDPDFILEEIEVGLREKASENHQYKKNVDRRAAIAEALKLAQADDVVIIAGKGHETYQILKDRTISFDDRQTVRELVKELRL